MLNGLYILDSDAMGLVYGPSEVARIARHVNILGTPLTKHSLASHRQLLKQADVIFSGWGMPVVDHAFLHDAPALKAIFYAAGATNGWLTTAVAERDVVVTTAHHANSLPVAEYALGMILLSLKHAFQLAYQTRHRRTHPDRNGSAGCYGSTVGLISFGEVATILRERLRDFDVNVLVYDPFLTASRAKEFDVEAVSLEQLFRRSDVVSLHTPLLENTVGLITGDHLASMKLGATFINTARGAVVREEEMLSVLSRRRDLQAILDTVTQEPPPPESPLYDLPNVFHTPHIAGSAGPECRRMGRYMADELERYVAAEPLKWELRWDSIRESPAHFLTPVDIADGQIAQG